MATQPFEGWRERLARRLAGEPFYMASALAAYRDLTGLDEPALAAHLSCSPADLHRLALCRRPDPSSPRFTADVRAIAAATGVDTLALLRLLRAVDAAAALSGPGGAHAPGGEGFVAAARDRESEEEAGEPPPEEVEHG